jgi:hypothetical protein
MTEMFRHVGYLRHDFDICVVMAAVGCQGLTIATQCGHLCALHIRLYHCNPNNCWVLADL